MNIKCRGVVSSQDCANGPVVDRDEAESMLALKKVKNCLSTCDSSKASTGRLSLKSRRIPLTVLTVSLFTFDA